jgi:hypothetical protein
MGGRITRGAFGARIVGFIELVTVSAIESLGEISLTLMQVKTEKKNILPGNSHCTKS